ncbi:hypothetical protein RJ55_06756 [Drechmeria coniospora]|nr:hypothetical protein RJ55_06756 [Drechmeria coniospora]
MAIANSSSKRTSHASSPSLQGNPSSHEAMAKTTKLRAGRRQLVPSRNGVGRSVQALNLRDSRQGSGSCEAARRSMPGCGSCGRVRARVQVGVHEQQVRTQARSPATSFRVGNAASWPCRFAARRQVDAGRPCRCSRRRPRQWSSQVRRLARDFMDFERSPVPDAQLPTDNVGANLLVRSTRRIFVARGSMAPLDPEHRAMQRHLLGACRAFHLYVRRAATKQDNA